MAETNNNNQPNLEDLLGHLLDGISQLNEKMAEVGVSVSELVQATKQNTEASKETTRAQSNTSFNPGGVPNQRATESLLREASRIASALEREQARIATQQTYDTSKANQAQSEEIYRIASTVFNTRTGYSAYNPSDSHVRQRMDAYMPYMGPGPNSYYSYVHENPMAYPYQSHAIGRIRAGYATNNDYPFLKDYFYKQARDQGHGNVMSQIMSRYQARSVINAQQVYRSTGISIGPMSEGGGMGSTVLNAGLMLLGGHIGKIGQFLLNQFIKIGEFLVDGFKQYWGFTAMKERIGAAAQTRLSTHVLGSDLSIGDISTTQLGQSWGLARMMGFSGSSTEWGQKLSEAANAGLASDRSERMIERSAIDMFMVQQGFGVNVNANQYASMFRANQGNLDLVHIMNALRAVSFANRGRMGTTAGFDNMNTLFESLASHVLRTNDGFTSMIRNMGAFSKLLANSSISMNELQSMVGATQTSTLQQRMMVAYYSGASNLLEGSERQIGLSRSDPAALIRLQARALLNMAAQQGYSANSLRSNAVVREALLDKFNMSSLSRLPNVIQTLQELASGATTKNTKTAVDMLEDEKSILANQLKGIDALVNTTKHIQAWLFTDKGTESFTDNIKQMYSKFGDELAEWLGVADPTMQQKDTDHAELLGKLDELVSTGYRTAKNTDTMAEAQRSSEYKFYDNGGYND